MEYFWQHFQCCPRCGAQYRPGDLCLEPLSLQCAACRYEFFQNSSPAATAVVPSRVNPRQIILLTRTAPPGDGLLALPGGFLQFDEPPYEAVRREVAEEILLDIDVDRLLDAYLVKYEFRGSMISVVEMVFVAKPVDYDVGSIRTGEAASVGYYDAADFLHSAARLAFPEQQQALTRYCDYLRTNDDALHI
jgi:ADP-ribose pyrophosphatase YjhB (NUDIX family)